MKARISPVIILTLALSGSLPIDIGSGQTVPRYAPDRIIVKFKQHSGSTAEAELMLLGGARAEVLDLAGPDGGGDVRLVHLDVGTSVEEALELASMNPRVEYAEPDYLVYPMETTPNDPLFGDMWGLMNTGGVFGGMPGADIGATRAWDITTGSDSVVVAIADSGIDFSHPDLFSPPFGSNIWVNVGEVPGNAVDDDGNGLVDDVNGWDFFSNNNAAGPDPLLGAFFSHGTHVAGTIGALGNNATGVTGVAWRVKLMSLKMFGRNPSGEVSGTTSDAVRAINYAINQRSRGSNVRVINASWAGDEESRTLHDAIAAAGNAGIVFVCSSGNGGDNMDIGSKLYPAAWTDLPSLISVAALDRSDNLASFSNFGHSTVTVGAPGVSILSTVPNGGYAVLSGTSMSAPHVSGIAALLAASEPNLGPAAIRRRIVRTVQPVLSLASKAVSSGRANAFNALTNTRAPVGDPAVSAVTTTKKAIVIDGIGFAPGFAVVEVNGASLSGKVKYDTSFALANGSFTKVWVRIGKFSMNQIVPVGVLVTITVFNPATGKRSAPFQFIRS